ncbi:MAG: hypothetical protein WBB19_02110 [Desulforhopalus sp.]
MSLIDMDFDFTRDSGSSLTTDNYSFYTDAEWDDTFNTSFDLAGSTTEDSGWWDSVMNMANTRLGTGLIGGAAKGLSNYYSDKSANERYDKAIASNEKVLADKVNTRAAHNASISKPHSGAKKVTYR